MGENKISRGMGRIEFVATTEELRKLFAAGYNLRIAYNELKKSNKITMSYSSFCGYAKKMYADFNAPQTVAVKTTTTKHPNDSIKASPPSSSKMGQTIKTKWSDDEVI